MLKHSENTNRLRLVDLTLAIAIFTIAVDHANLYLRESYDHIPRIGVLFSLTAAAGISLGLLILLRGVRRYLALASILFSASVLVGYLLSIWLPKGIFLFKEPGISYSGMIAIAAEIASIAVSAATLAKRSRQKTKQ